MRHFEFAVDHGHAKAVNETLGDVRRLRVSSIVVGLLFAAGAVWLYLRHSPWSYILAAVLAVAAVMSWWVSVWAPRKVGSIEDLYRRGPLVPAMVSETRPRGATILALIDIAKPETAVPHYALVVRNVRALPGHTLTEGERVPSVAVLGDRNPASTAETWQLVSPMPIAWGTRDRGVLRRAVDAVDPVEWQLLRRNLGVSEKVRGAENERMLIDPHDLPAELLERGDDA